MITLPDAAVLAGGLVDSMRSFCARVEIAGSIRRRKAKVRDIEIVAIPKWLRMKSAGLFTAEEGSSRNELHEWATKQAALIWIKPGTPEIAPWPIRPDGKYWRGLLPQGMKLDLFLCRPENWGLILLIRTGSADFSRAVVTHALRRGTPIRNGMLTNEERDPVSTPEEEDVFRRLMLPWIPPEHRCDGRVLTNRLR